MRTPDGSEELVFEIDSENEITLPPGETIWITVNNLSVYVKHEDEGVIVDVYGLGAEGEDRDLIDTLQVEYSENGRECPVCGHYIVMDGIEDASFKDHGKCHSCHKERQMDPGREENENE